MEAATIFLRAHSASEQLKSPDTCVALVASVKNGLTHQKICTSSKKNTALLDQQPPKQTIGEDTIFEVQPPVYGVRPHSLTVLSRCLTGTVAILLATLGQAWAQNQAALAGIDHIPIAVRNLEQASEDFKRFGFSIKPGRQHSTGVRNKHIKFPDGSGLELITASIGTDELSAVYLNHLKDGDGPAYVSFHVRDSNRLALALAAAKIDFDQTAGLTTFKDPRLGSVFIATDNRSPTDQPEHFAHPNGAFAISEVWIACEDSAPLRSLLFALGATSNKSIVRVPEPTDGETFELQNGRVVIVPGRHQLLPGRPVVGVVMSVKQRAGNAAVNPYGSQSLRSSTSGWLVAPKNAHGMWLELRAEQ